MIISEEAYERVQNIIEDINICCVTEDDYNEWEDIAASSIGSFMDELDTEQFKMTCEALREWIDDNSSNKKNMTMGVKTAFERYLRERIEYLDDYVVPKVLLTLAEDEEYDDTNTAKYRKVVERQLEVTQNM